MQIVLARPEWFARLGSRLSPEDFDHAGMRQLFAVCGELAEQGVSPDLGHVLAAVDDLELKKLVTWLDDSARAKGFVPDAESGTPTASEELENIVEHLVRTLEWERQRSVQEDARRRLRRDGQEALHEEDRDVLRRLTEWHRQRVAKDR